MDHTATGMLPALPPFLKWAGGKRWFMRRHSDLLPTQFKNYYEPFLGGGAAFFALRPTLATLSDTNRDLIDTYEAIRNDWRLVWRYLQHHQIQHSEQYYYECRARKARSLHARAARFLYLNRACWNGLYRVNRKGEFNVPKGTKQSIIFDDDDFDAVSDALSTANLRCADFEKIIDEAQCGDLVFADPPYTVNHNMNGFLKYNEHIFSWRDQSRLCDAVCRAAQRGAKVVVTNADHISIHQLYRNIGNISIVPRHSVLAGDSAFRRSSTELVIRIGF